MKQNWYIPCTGIVSHRENSFSNVGHTFYIPPSYMSRPTDIKRRMSNILGRTPMNRNLPPKDTYGFTETMKESHWFYQAIGDPTFGLERVKAVAKRARALLPPNKEIKSKPFGSITRKYGETRICHEGFPQYIIDNTIYQCRRMLNLEKTLSHVGTPTKWLISAFLYQKMFRLPLVFIIWEGNSEIYLLPYENLMKMFNEKYKTSFCPDKRMEWHVKKALDPNLGRLKNGEWDKRSVVPKIRAYKGPRIAFRS